MTDGDYYVLVNGEETGPFTLGQLDEMLRKQEITLETYWAQPGMAEWKPVSDLLEPSAAPRSNGCISDVGLVVVGDVASELGVVQQVTVEPRNPGATASAAPDCETEDQVPILSACELALLSRLQHEAAGAWSDYGAGVADVARTVEFLRRRALVRDAPLARRFDVKFRLVELKSYLRLNHVLVTGKKADLIERLIGTVGQERASRMVAGVCPVELTAEGVAAVRTYEAKKAEERRRIEAEALAALRQALREADTAKVGQIVAAFEAQQPFSRGVGCVRSEEMPAPSIEEAAYLLDACWDLDCDVDQKLKAGACLALSSLLGETVVQAVERFREALGGVICCPAMGEFARSCNPEVSAAVFGEREEDDLELDSEFGDDNDGVYVQTKLAEAACRANLASFRRSSAGKGVEVCGGDICPICREGKRKYSWRDLETDSPLPRHWGCTCCYVAWLRSPSDS